MAGLCNPSIGVGHHLSSEALATIARIEHHAVVEIHNFSQFGANYFPKLLPCKFQKFDSVCQVSVPPKSIEVLLNKLLALK